MAIQSYVQVSHVDIDRLYVDDMTPESWLELEVRTVQLLEEGELSPEQSRVIVHALRDLQARGEALPRDASELYLLMRPILERLPGGYG